MKVRIVANQRLGLYVWSRPKRVLQWCCGANKDTHKDKDETGLWILWNYDYVKEHVTELKDIEQQIKELQEKFEELQDKLNTQPATSSSSILPVRPPVMR